MDVSFVLTGFAVGLFGSVHCLGMCGPIALMLPVSDESVFMQYWKRSVYNAGRVVTYSALGAAIGALGFSASYLGIQKWVSIGSGALLIGWVIVSRLANRRRTVKTAGFLSRNIQRLLKNNSTGGQFSLGLLNGLLPCGFVYVGLVGAANAHSIGGGALYMALFGLGTFPLMFMASIAGPSLNIAVRQKILNYVPVMTVILGLLFILRGMELGIPFISPDVSAMTSGAMGADSAACH